MKNISFIIAFVLITQIAFSQSLFQMRYGSTFYDHSTKAIQTQDGNFVTVGITNGFGSGGNAFIMKVNSTGGLLWVKDYSGINGDLIADIVELSDRTLVMCGGTGSYGAGASDAFLMKTDSVGNLIWARAYGDIFSESFNKLTLDGAGGFYVAGYADDVSTFQRGSIMCRIDNSGNILWVRWVDADLGADDPKLTAISSGGVILGDRVLPNTSFSLWKFSPTGTLVWSNNYTPTPVGSGLFDLSVIENGSGEIIVNTSLSNVNTVAQSVDNFIIKLNSSGGLISDKSYGGLYVDNSITIANTSDGGIIICGSTNSAGNGYEDDCLIKIQSSGNVEWAKAYGTAWAEKPNSVIETSDMGFVFTGFTYSTGSNYDSTKVHLVKTDSLGNTLCNAITWGPIMTNQTLSISSASAPINFSFPGDNPITWTLNNRNFYAADICSPVSSITSDSANELKWNLYPNPFSTTTTIETKTVVNSVTFEMFNLFGKLVKQIHLSSSKSEITRENLSDGVYIYQIVSDNKVIDRGKLIIQ